MPPGGEPLALARTYEGRSFGPYRIARAIATGGMATVFLARRTGPGRFAQTAALKVIHPHLAQEREFVDMFLEEARIASSINHPNVCRVLDFGQAEGTFYLAMEYVRGETWATTLEALSHSREGRQRLHALTAYVLAQACWGLHAAHEAVDATGLPLQIVHRDISPQNLFVAYDGSVRLLDFGIASARDKANDAASSSQPARGRYAYMAPEQIRGLEVDLRADIWSLGVVLREALCGERLFARDTQVATILAVTKDSLPPWPPHVPLLLREICDRALARDPEERFASARELGSALGRALSGEPEAVSSAELGRFMRALFPEEIARKRAELRALAGDDSHSDTFTSIVPPSGVQPAFGRSEEFELPAGLPQPRRWAWWMLAALGSLLSAFAAFQLTPRFVARTPVGRAALRAEAKAPAAEVPEAHGTELAGAAPAEGARALDSPQRVEDTHAREASHAEDLPVAGESVGSEPASRAPEIAALSEEEAREARRQARRERRRERKRLEAEAQGAARASATEAVLTPTDLPDAPPTQPATESATGPGTLVIGTERGWAEVSVDGRKLGNTPLRTSLPAGDHMLEVRFFGTGSARTQQVHVRAGEVTKLRLSQ